MPQFNATKAFERLRAQSRRQRIAVLEAGMRKQKEWAAHGQRSAALSRLMNVFPSQSDGAVNFPRVNGLMIEYAETLSVDWVKARCRSVSARLAKLIKDGKPIQYAGIKEVLLNLLLVANARDHAKVERIFNEAIKCDPDDVERFRFCLLNWLVDKVVDGCLPLPDELKPSTEEESEEAREVETSLEVGLTTAANEEWVPALRAVERAEQSGHPITLKWLTQNSPKHGVRLRPCKQGRHHKEVEWNSLAGHLLKQARPEKELDEKVIDGRIREAQEQKRKERSLT